MLKRKNKKIDEESVSIQLNIETIETLMHYIKGKLSTKKASNFQNTNIFGVSKKEKATIKKAKLGDQKAIKDLFNKYSLKVYTKEEIEACQNIVGV